MIGLPKVLNVNGTDRAIRSDYRVALLIFQAYNDPELDATDKTLTMLECLYDKYEEIPPEGIEEAARMAAWFLDGGTDPDDNVQNIKKVMDWEQDEQLIFSSVNKVAGYETREKEYMHWWSFLGLFQAMGEGLFTTVVNIRAKKNKGKKLEKHEDEFYRENRRLIDLKKKISAEQQEEIDRLDAMLG